MIVFLFNILTNVQPVIDIAKIQIKNVSYVSYGGNVGRKFS